MATTATTKAPNSTKPISPTSATTVSKEEPGEESPDGTTVAAPDPSTTVTTAAGEATGSDEGSGTTIAAEDPEVEVLAGNITSEIASNGLLADISLDQLILVLLGFAIAIGLTLNGAIRAWKRGPA